MKNGFWSCSPREPSSRSALGTSPLISLAFSLAPCGFDTTSRVPSTPAGPAPHLPEANFLLLVLNVAVHLASEPMVKRHASLYAEVGTTVGMLGRARGGRARRQGYGCVRGTPGGANAEAEHASLALSTWLRMIIDIRPRRR